MIAGFASAGWRARSLGVIPTPAAARAVEAGAAALGVVITASHNPASDNGIKFFGGNGRKLTDADEAAIEAILAESAPNPGGTDQLRPPAAVEEDSPGRDGHQAALADYVATVGRLLPESSLRGWRIVLDTANGATCRTSPAVLMGLGADLICLGRDPDGSNINAGVGSEHPELMAAQVRSSGASLGVAHDGDGDRCILCDELGVPLDGDEILTILATHALARGRLAADTLVVTVHSNLGVDAAIAAAGGRVVRAAVGDRYVVERMAAEGANMGGESSGHMVFSEISWTGDGLVAALKTIEVMLATARPLSDLRRVLRKFPQATATVPAKEKKNLAEMATLPAAIRRLESELATRGRVLVRYSGTEPILRLLVEGPDQATVRAGLDRLVRAARRDLS